MKIVVIGGGRQGNVMARNILARKEKPEVTIADINESIYLPQGASFAKCNVLNADEIAKLVKGSDAVALAVPSHMAHEALTHILKTGIPVVDVSFTPTPPLELDDLAKKTGSCCIVDCGIAPGLSHLLIGSAYAKFGCLDKVRIIVGGMPQHPPKTFKHAVYFNPLDLLEEYIRPARARKDGKNIAPLPLDVPVEIYHDKDLGQLDAFLSDGLRSLLTSYPDINNMTELTLRWPGHIAAITTLNDMGLLKTEESRAAIAASLGADYPAHAYPDVLVMAVDVSYANYHIGWRLIDKRTNDESAMSRTTAYTTAAMTMALARKQYTKPGVVPPEALGSNAEFVKTIVDDLSEHGILLTTVENTECCTA